MVMLPTMFIVFLVQARLTPDPRRSSPSPGVANLERKSCRSPVSLVLAMGVAMGVGMNMETLPELPGLGTTEGRRAGGVAPKREAVEGLLRISPRSA